MNVTISLALTIVLAVGCAAQQQTTGTKSIAVAEDPLKVQRDSAQVALLGDAKHANLRPYAEKVIEQIRVKWYPLIANIPRIPDLTNGKCLVEFTLSNNGKLAEANVVTSSGQASLDDAAVAAIKSAAPFPEVPASFPGKSLALRGIFLYNSSRTADAQKDNLEVLSDTEGVDFGPYLSRVVQSVRLNWYRLIPDEARAPLLKKGKVSIEFMILPDGKMAGIRISESSGNIAMDRSAWGGVTASAPFAPLPEEFDGPYLALRFHFQYNPSKRPPDQSIPSVNSP